MGRPYNTILFEIADGVARLTLNRPDRLNSFTVEMHEEIAAALREVKTGPARALLLTGAGRAFCAGQDLSDPAVGPGADLGEMLDARYNPLVFALTRLEIPVIAAVNGVAAGAGANIALAADIVLAARSAKFIQAFAGVGLVPDSGGTWVLPRLVGQARAMGLALTGEPLPAETAERWGLIWKAVDDDALAGEADTLARRFAAAPTAGLAAAKRAIRTAFTQRLDQQLDLEASLQRELGRSHDYQEGVAAFLEKRPPSFLGR